MHSELSPAWPIRLGCPVWSCRDWVGDVYPTHTPRSRWLSWYSQTFNTVEGNSTFYAIPSIETTERWADQTADGFRFALKFPSLISHQLKLLGAEDATLEFLRCIEPLQRADRLGPTFLQLGPGFGPDGFFVLERYLRHLPREMSFAVEFRHHGWFDSGCNEERVNELLRELQIDKVILDSRPLFQSPAEDQIELAVQRRKPETPVRQTVTAKHPMLRIVGRNRCELVDPFFDQWVPIVAKWVGQGLEPFIFTHTPNEAHAPALARRFAAQLSNELLGIELAVPTHTSPRQLTFLQG